MSEASAELQGVVIEMIEIEDRYGVVGPAVVEYSYAPLGFVIVRDLLFDGAEVELLVTGTWLD